MESGLEDRNNAIGISVADLRTYSLNGVRPRRPEQSKHEEYSIIAISSVSMESGLEDRNNDEVYLTHTDGMSVSMESGLEDRNNQS